MMKILFYVYEWPPIGGGVANAAFELMKQFSKNKDLEIDVVTTSINGKFYIKQFSKNIQLHFLPLGDRRERLTSQTVLDMMTFSFVAYWYTWKLFFLGKRYDLTNFFGYPGGLVSWLFSWRWPYIVSLRGVEVPGYNKVFSIWYRVYGILARVVWLGSRQVVVNSIWLGELARETLSSSEYLVVRNGVDTKILNQVQNDKKDKFKKFTVTAGATVMGKKKGLKYLVEGFADLNQQFPESRLLLIGDGDSQSILESQVSELGIKDVVKFVGHKDKKWIARNLPKCHVLCLPSLAEGMSNAILEGMACGLPIVTTNPSKELIDGNGIIVKSMDSDQISKALSELYKNNKVRKSMSKKSRELAEKMSWDKVAKEYHKVYRDTVSS